MFSDSAFRTTYIIFVIVTILVFITKPNSFFKPDGQIKPFGIRSSSDETPFTLTMFIYGLLIICYIITVYLDHAQMR